MELAVVIALVETFGAALYKEARMSSCSTSSPITYGAGPKPASMSPPLRKKTLLADALSEVRLAFEFLCATWHEVFLARTHALRAGIGARAFPEADPTPSSNTFNNDPSCKEDEARGKMTRTGREVMPERAAVAHPANREPGRLAHARGFPTLQAHIFPVRWNWSRRSGRKFRTSESDMRFQMGSTDSMSRLTTRSWCVSFS
ncbi:hypothetical protein AWB76_04809 [Caballeronia temeraria]|uniref:Uncharacterized protein n=1 Tax=Caballeronia temeraria TaxID=1777137 RepID=A0A158BX13_9BURK|nr:hypothetical protein AWB76_04809 [Caballeronia temeraria]